MALKPPVSIAQARRSPKAAARRKSFCARMGGMRKKLTGEKTAKDPNSRINHALADWDCDIPELLPRQYVTRRIRVSNPEALMGIQRPHWDMNMGESFDHPGRDSDLFDENPRARLVQRASNPSDLTEKPFRYIVQIGDSDSPRAINWLLTVDRPGTLVTLWSGEKIRHMRVWYRLPAKLVKSPSFQRFAKERYRYIHGHRRTDQLEAYLMRFLKK